MLSINASGLSRVMNCAGSLSFKDLPEELPSEKAKEGVAAGEYLEHLINKNENIPIHARNGVNFDEDMKFYAQTIHQEIRERAGDGEIICENKVNWQTHSGIWIKARLDASFVCGTVLYIDDYKYGWGLVEAKENWQLLAYGIGEVIKRNVSFSEVVLRIHQPRPHHEDGVTREWRISYSELLKYKDTIEKRMTEIVQGEDSLVSGDQCRYCRASAVCPAFNKAFYRGVDVIHEFIQDNITEKELSFQLDLLDRVTDILKIKKSSLETLAVHRIQNGKLITNWVSEETFGHRKWKKGISPDVIKTLTGKDILQKSMMSPAKAEKMGIAKDFIASLVERPFAGQKLKRRNTTDLGNKIFGNPSE